MRATIICGSVHCGTTRCEERPRGEQKYTVEKPGLLIHPGWVVLRSYSYVVAAMTNHLTGAPPPFPFFRACFRLESERVNIYIICATKTCSYTPVAHHLAASGSGCILFSRHALLLLTASPPSRRMCAIQLWCLSQHIARRNGQCSMRARVCFYAEEEEDVVGRPSFPFSPAFFSFFSSFSCI